MKIEIKNITKKYGKHQVLKGITFEARSGQCIGILGGNGCGKSTLLSILAGIQNADAGEFLFEGKDLFHYKRQREKLVGYVPQGTPLIEELSAKDNLSLWYSKKEMAAQLENGVLYQLHIGDFLKTPVNKMSGGMKKRLSIACALAHRPPVLILDEPTAALDLVCKQYIARYIQSYKKDGGIVLIATHDVSEIALCDRVYIMKNGVLQPFQFDGDPESIVKEL